MLPISFYRKAFQLDFGAYWGLARVLKSPSNPQNCRKKENILERGAFIFCAKLWYAPIFKRDLILQACISFLRCFTQSAALLSLFVQKCCCYVSKHNFSCLARLCFLNLTRLVEVHEAWLHGPPQQFRHHCL